MANARISLSLVLHNHQPVGNFGFVFEDNHRLAYQPMVDALERHPTVRVGLHYTGPLLQWLKAERPDTIAQIRRLVDRQQVEVLGGGYYEPVLASLPQRDRLGQLERMASEIEALVGHRPRGAWLAERVWEPDLPVALVGVGYQYTVLDDAHLRAAAIPDEQHWGIYSTDDQGRKLLVFGTEQGLRYHIPFRPVEEVIEYLRAHATEAGDRIGMMGDDGEKFGGWPGTWELCWGEEAWIERFFAALEQSADWLSTVRPADAIDTHRPLGRVYIPTGSYTEMGEWSLPLEARREYTRLRHAATSAGRPEARWMRGGFWRNFQVNYTEIGDLHKQMLRVSAAVAAVLAGDPASGGNSGIREAIVDHLYQGQSNDCYWHGLFGGIYLSHMRLATAAHLIAAEDAVDRLIAANGDTTQTSVELTDIDLDGFDEILCKSPGQVVAIKPSEGGGIMAWDVRPARHALTSVMRRRPEAYHDTLVAHESGHSVDDDQGAVSIHDRVQVTEPGLSQRLWYDDHERRSGLVRFLAAETTADALERSRAVELGDFVAGAFEVLDTSEAGIVLARLGEVALPKGVRVPVRVTKSFSLEPARLEPAIRLSVAVANEGTLPIEARLAVEWSLNMLGGGGNPQAWFETDGEHHRFDERGTASQIAAVAMGNDGVGISLTSSATPAADAWWYSIETISLSELGFERNHQGSCLLWSWPLRLEPGASATFSIDSHIVCAVDRALEEGL